MLLFKEKLTTELFRKRETALKNYLKKTLAESKFSGRELREHQGKKLRELLQYAFEDVPFYRQKYEKAGFTPDQFISLADLSKIPVLTKEELRGAPKETLISERGKQAAHFMKTSGSTGSPVGMYRSEEAMCRFTTAAMLQFYQWCGGKPLRNVLYIIDSNPGTIDYAIADYLRTIAMEERFISAFAHADELRDAVDLYQPEYISGYPSAIRNLALFAVKRGEAYPFVKLINVTSEMIDASARKLFSVVFPSARIVETYTSTEGGFMGYQCLDKGGFHLAEDTLFVETIRDSASSRLGKLIITDLSNFATPVIRYEGLGDIVTMAAEPCSCGSLFLRIEGLEGRFVDSIILEDGTRMTPYVLTNLLSEEEGILKYQIIQEEANRFIIRIVPEPGRKNTLAELGGNLEAAFRKALNSDVRCELKPEDDILPAEGSHKAPLVISRINR